MRSSFIVWLIFVSAVTAFGSSDAGEVYHDELLKPAVPSDAAKLSAVQRSQFLEVICPGHATDTGCSVCPLEASVHQGSWQAAAIIFGHFQTPTSVDALVSGFGCEPHAASYGGSFLFTKNNSAWQKLWYSSGEIAEDCKNVTGSDRRDLLVCEDAYRSYGGVDSRLYGIDPARDPRKPDPRPLDRPDPFGEFFSVTDTLASCSRLPDGTVSTAKIVSVSFQRAESGRVNIVVSARLGKAKLPQSILDRCSSSPKSTLQITGVPVTYRFQFDGSKLMPLKGNPPMKYSEAIAPRTSYSISK